MRVKSLLDSGKYPVLSRYQGTTLEEAEAFFAILTEEEKEQARREAAALGEAVSGRVKELELFFAGVTKGLSRMWEAIPEEVKQSVLTDGKGEVGD